MTGFEPATTRPPAVERQIIYLCVVFVSTYLNFPPIGIKLDENCNQNVIEI